MQFLETWGKMYTNNKVSMVPTSRFPPPPPPFKCKCLWKLGYCKLFQTTEGIQILLKLRLNLTESIQKFLQRNIFSQGLWPPVGAESTGRSQGSSRQGHTGPHRFYFLLLFSHSNILGTGQSLLLFIWSSPDRTWELWARWNTSTFQFMSWGSLSPRLNFCAASSNLCH